MAQTLVWSEDFSTHANGTTSDPGGKWSSSCIGCTSNGSSFFEVRGNAFEGQNTDEEGIWLSEWINIASYDRVNLSVLIEGDNSNDVGDYCIAEYRTAAGAYTGFVNGNNDDMNAITRTAVAQIDSKDSVQIRIRLDVSATNEQYVFDNIYVVAIQSQPGSGSTLDFDDLAGATNGDVIELGNFPNIVGGDFTMAAWINSDNVASAGQRIFCDDENNSADGFSISLGDPGTGRIRFYIRSVSPVSMDMSNSAYYLSSNKWYHIAAVHDASANSRTIYVNGISAQTGTYTGNPGGSPDGIAAIGGEPASSAETSNRFNGEIDEVSIWSAALTQNQIRDLMCEKLDTSDANLLAYYKIDDGIGYTARDEKGNYPGGMTNMDPATDWVTSGAAIGDVSTHLYTGSWAGQSVILESSQEDSLVISSVTGSPDGLHVYDVQESPNDTSGAGGVGGNNHYFGVFKAFGTSPTYTATYHYLHNDAFQIGALDESAMALYKRDDNADATWTDASAALNTVNKTLVLTGESTEYILGNTFAPLPITLLSFSAKYEGDVVSINWTTLEEINNDYFEIERSIDATNFYAIEKIQGAGNSNGKLDYSATDNEPIANRYSYYRLSQTDYNGSKSYSKIDAIFISKSEDKMEPVVFPNPVMESEFFIHYPPFKALQVTCFIFDPLGKMVSETLIQPTEDGLMSINAPENDGLYILKVVGGTDSFTKRILVK